MLKWGLIPSWAKEPSIGNKLANARADTGAEKPAFRSAFKKHRCLVIADGFYEWRAASSTARPAGVRPYAHPYYWASFILIGDPR